jgi:hypothetical protein
MVMEQGYAVAETHAKVPQKKKKIGFFKRWMLQSVKEAVNAERNLAPIGDPDVLTTKQIALGRSAMIDQPERAIHFTVYVANGGRVIETRKIDRKTDRSTNGLYIITNDQDFGREIDKIITMESLR